MEKLNTVLALISCNVKGNIKFPVMETQSFMQTSVDALDLDTRSSNALKRGGLYTIQDIVNNYEKLKDIRSCGTKSINRIKYKICAYYY